MMGLMEQDIAVTVIGGYLGSGKTTLINHVLRTADERVAVLVNDFGSINIDADLIESQDGDTIALSNGCICCSLVDGFAAALATVRDLDPSPRRLLIEASGVADPATVAAYGHGPGLMLDAVVVMVDAETIRNRATDKYVGDTVLRQLASGDLLVINKVDLVGADKADSVRQWLAARCPDAALLETTQSQVPIEVLFGVQHKERDGIESGSENTDASGQSHADQVFQTWTWTTDQLVERTKIEQLMAELPDDVVRAKGVVVLAQDPQRATVVQRVGKRWTIHPSRTNGPPASSHLVFIGMPDSISDRWLNSRL